MLVDVATCEKTPLSHLYIKAIILTRQARDKHRENSKDGVFRTHVAAVIAAVVAAERWVGVDEGEVPHQLRPRRALGSVESSNGEWIDAGVLDSPAKNGFFEPFIYKNEHFAKTGSGQT